MSSSGFPNSAVQASLSRVFTIHLCRTDRERGTEHHFDTESFNKLPREDSYGTSMSSARLPCTDIEVRDSSILFLPEPTNKIAPRNDKGKKFEGGEIFIVPQSDSAYLTCEVAGYPVPIYRYVWHHTISSR